MYVQEYLGSYITDTAGRLTFREGALLTALRRGQWLVLDELNLAPSEVLEALHRCASLSAAPVDACSGSVKISHQAADRQPRLLSQSHPQLHYDSCLHLQACLRGLHDRRCGTFGEITDPQPSLRFAERS